MPDETMRSWWRFVIGLAIVLGIAAPSSTFADPLGDARLFFTRAERDLVSSARSEAASSEHDPNEHDPDPGRSGGRGVSSRRRVVVRGSGAIDTSTTAARHRIGFDALLRTGERIRVIVGGSPCQAARAGTELQCHRVPDGVDSLALAPDGRRLIVTFDDGRRANVAVGEAIEP